MGRTVTITDSNIYVIDSTATGPLGYGLSALLIGRSSMSKIGVFVLPGLIDADYTGPIKIMIKVFSPPVTITSGSKIAQLIPFKACVPQAVSAFRGKGAFGSTSTNDNPMVLFTTNITRERPKREVLLSHKAEQIGPFSMLLDTGADVTIIPFQDWPEAWPLDTIQTPVTGISGNAKTLQSKTTICFTDVKEGQIAWTKPYVMHTTLWILGRDVLSQWGVQLQSTNNQPF